MKSTWLQRIEVITGLSVVVTLVVLIVEVRTNTREIQRQIFIDRVANIAAPFVSGPELLQAYERIKSKDGWEPDNRAFMDRYELEPAQAIAWTRFLMINWAGLEADFLASGPSERLARQVRGLLVFPDNQLLWETGTLGFTPGFRAYVEQLTSGEAVESG